MFDLAAAEAATAAQRAARPPAAGPGPLARARAGAAWPRQTPELDAGRGLAPFVGQPGPELDAGSRVR